MTERAEPARSVAQSGPVRSALMGAVLAVDGLGHCLAMATLLFSGSLAAGLGLATAVFVLGSLVATLVLMRFSLFPAPLAISQDTTISILAPAVALSAGLAVGPPGAAIATGFAVIGLSAILSGAAFWLIGRLGLGRLIRMFPFSVAAGFLAGSGYLLVFAALSILTEASGPGALMSAMADPQVQMRLLPALAMALTLFLAMAFIGGTLPILAVVFLFLGGHYAVCALLGITPDRMVELGLLPQTAVAGDGGGLDLGLSALTLIDWSAVAVAAPTFAAVMLLNVIGLLLNLTGVEIATRTDVRESRELRIAGLTNLAIGAAGSLTAFLQGGASIIAAKLGVSRGAFIAGHAAVLAPGVLLAPTIVAVTPSFIPGALLMFIGLSMLWDWLFATRRRLTPVDWCIVLAIVLATALVGMLWAIAIGLALAVFGFALASVRVPVLRKESTAATRRSICDRNALQDAVLEREGHRIRILHLQGPLFFGSVEQMTRRLRATLTTDPAIAHVILDLSEVQSFDSSACVALDKLQNLAAIRNIAVHLTGLSPGLRAVFDRWGLALVPGGAKASGAGFHLWPDLDHALDHGETDLLARFGGSAGGDGVDEVLRHLARDHSRLPDLLALMDRRHLSAGEVLIRAADPSRDVFVVASGRFGVHLPATTGTSPSLRVRAIGTGTIVGEAAHLTGAPRSADVICEEAAEVLILSEASITRIEREDPTLATLMLAILGRSLATKLAQTNRLLAYATDGGLAPKANEP